jgi:hypothetical protein
MTDSRVNALEAARRLLDLCKRRDDAPSWMDIETVALLAHSRGEKESGIENDEIARQAERPGWRTMESAPKDGTEVLVFAKDKPRPGYWDDCTYAKKPKPYWHYTSAWGINDMRTNPPTHWQPLPTPPAPGK